ncbi:MAG: helix-hairpin-helix domain-containing protein [Streptococcaceae bacterium]|jgi:competence protein ComEA|nr:helix-hairpin-helix domain-containing protein [Streptococcaceae bacterium]
MAYFKTMLVKWRAQLMIGGIVLALVLALFSFWWLNRSVKPAEEISLAKASAVKSTEETKEKVEKEQTAEVLLVVDIKGAVKNPGIYQAAANLRVNDIVNLAGGLLDNAEVRGINLAKKISDEMVIYVPYLGEDFEDLATDTEKTDSSSSQEAQGKINLNTATQETLQQISGIGAKKSADIIKYREENGPFKALEDLKQVSGIGDKTIENIREYVTINKTD